MVERLLIIKKDELNNGNGKMNRLEQTQSFNTEDDESISPDDPQQLSETDSRIEKSGTAKSSLDDLKRSLLSIHSPSIDSVNDPDGLSPDTPLSEKAKRKKLRRETEQLNQEEAKRQVVKSQPWYTKVDFTKPIMILAFLFLLYIMWEKSDVWIPRLLTSNTRIRHIALANEQKLAEKDDSPPPPQSSSSSSSSPSSDNSSSTFPNQDEIANANDNNDNKNNNKNNDQISISINEESPPIATPKASVPQKLNIRIRRNKMSFSKERGGTKNRRLRQKIVDGDDYVNVDDIDDNVDDIVDDNNSIESDDDDKSIESKQFILPSSIHSSKKHHHHHHQSGISREKNLKTVPTSKTALVVPSQEEVFQRLEKLIKSRHRNRDLLTELAEETGIKKSKLKQFIQKKDCSFMTLDTLISFLDSYDASLLIVPK